MLSHLKRFRRVVSSEISQRPPPPNLPSTFYRPEYLDLVRKGLVPWVRIQESPAISIPKVNLSGGCKVTSPDNQLGIPLRREITYGTEPRTDSELTLKQEIGPSMASTYIGSDTGTKSNRFLLLLIEWAVVASALYALLDLFMD
ncbi:hypothetical protein VKT23_016145 [Stygiomarasmius scandens]|uniref:Uncharacterized protein n=1 Tax=Marasmiellus scandens TaxID=2682957 RepID=A0ABR1J0B7_9AGAR